MSTHHFVNKNKIMEAFVKFVFGLIIGVVSAIIRGFVLMKLWAWFVVGTFVIVPQINIVEAIGLMYVFTFLNVKEKDFRIGKEPRGFEHYITLIFVTIVYSFFILFFSWIVTLFM